MGDRVFHQKFGYGEIIGIEGDKLDIAFDKAGTKKVVARFVVSTGRRTTYRSDAGAVRPQSSSALSTQRAITITATEPMV